MADTQQKRLRDDFDDKSADSKRQKPYNNILSLLDEEEEQQQDPTHDLSTIFMTLQQELSSSAPTFDFDPPPFTAEVDSHHQQPTAADPGAEEDDGVKSVIRHLLEASDDELGIPNVDCNSVDELKPVESFPFGFADSGLWEIEDVAANYYAVMQSEFFM